MTTLKDRFNKKYQLASYEAVYARLYRDNKEAYEKSLESPVYPFSILEEVDKVYILGNPTIGRLFNHYDQDFYLGFDKSNNLFYYYRPKLTFLYDSLDEYITSMIEVMIA